MKNVIVQHVIRALPVFHLPGRANLLSCFGPFSLYRGVLVQWTERYDARVLTWIDELSEHQREHLVAATAHKGDLEVVWSDGRRRLENCVEVAGDCWTVSQEWDARTGTPCK